MRGTTIVLGLAFVFGLAGGALAQGHGAQGHGQHQAGIQGMQGMTASDRMMQNIDKMMANVSVMMQDLNAMHAGMAGAGQHHQVMTSMQGAFDQMRQLRGSLGEMMKDPGVMHNRDAMKSFEQACRSLEQMTTAFQSMARSMTRAMKGMGGAK